MAVVAFTTYRDDESPAIINTYISDGHGEPAMERSNRYISDGHGGTTECLGHQCPADPKLATAFMAAVRRNYEQSHSINKKKRKKSCVTHIQLYVSPTAEDNVPREERLKMIRELIERTVLRDFPCIYTAHDNTPDKHCHISLAPFSLDGTHKLGMNNTLLYTLRREMDRICVEYGYSIIDSPELRSDKAYRDWFFQVKAEGKIKIHPPKDEGKVFLKQEGKRARNYALSKRAQVKRKEDRENYYQALTRGYSPEKDMYFYTSPYLYHPGDPKQPLRVRWITPEGVVRSELELRASALGAWAYHCEKELEKKTLPDTAALQNRLHTIAARAFTTRQLVLELDIRSQEELIFHIKECGQDIATLKRNLSKLDAKLQEMQPAMQALELWEVEKHEKALEFLKRRKLDTPFAMRNLKKQYIHLLAKKQSHQELLEEYSKEYRRLKSAEVTLNPVSCKEEWEVYLETLFSKNVVQKANWITEEDLEERIYELGEVLGLDIEKVNQYLLEVQENAGFIRAKEYRDYRNRLLTARKTERKGYEQYYKNMDVLADLWELRDKLLGFGLLGVLLSAIVESFVELNESMNKLDLSAALWEAGLERWYAERKRRKFHEQMPYHPEVQQKIDKESQEIAARIQRMIEEVARFEKERGMIPESGPTVGRTGRIEMERE